MFVHLTAHSAYSLFEGVPLPAELARAAAAAGMPALGLTDHRLLSGAVEFVLACRQNGVQPILGLELDLEEGRLALLAENLAGWTSLCRLSSALALGPNPPGPCPLDLLDHHRSGLVALGSEELGPERLRQLKDIFPRACHLALSDMARGLPISRLGRIVGLPLAAARPIYMLTAGQVRLQRTLAAIRLNCRVDQVPAAALAPPGSIFSSPAEMEMRFQAFPGAITATSQIAERCRFELPLGQAQMPTVPMPPGLSAAAWLRQKAEAGARRIYGIVTPVIQARLDHELEVIARMGFEPIFLIVDDILQFARQQGVPFSSRGSAASSLVAHCLEITSPDPLRLNLYFERFLNPARSSPPDIDTDLCSRRRDRVIEHVFRTYGEDRVAMVATVNRFRPRSALGDAAKAYGLEPGRIRELTARLPYGFWARQEEDPEAPGGGGSPFDDLRSASAADPLQQEILEQAEALLKLPRHLSVHAGGLIVAPGAVTDLAPVMRSGSKGVIITQFDLGSVEALGLVKIDLLGIRGLTVLGDVAESIRTSGPQTGSSGRLAVLDSIPGDDLPTAQRVESGQTIGCFQIESPGMRATLRAIQARSIDDITAALALFRPGPLTGGLKDAFVRRFKGEEEVRHIHPALAPLLEETLGVILYQEQVLRIAHELAGFSLAEADLLRRAMSHFDPGRQMQALREKFIRQAEERSAIPPDTAGQVWEMIAAFAGYGFPKAHAASYARVAWRSAWCKTHFPAEFMAAVLANWGGYYSQQVYFNEARRMGLAVHPPHVNHSRRNFSVQPGTQELYMGLDQIRSLTRRTIERVIRLQPFETLEDFLARADPRPLEAANLARAGALSGLGTIPDILRRLQAGRWLPSQPGLFGWEDPPGPDWTAEQKMNAQQELLGIVLEAHPLELAADRIARSGAISTLEAAGQTGRRVTVAGLRQSSHRSQTARGEAMLFLTLEDLAGTLDVILFPDAYRQAKAAISSGGPLLVTGMVEMDPAGGEPLLRGEKVVPL